MPSFVPRDGPGIKPKYNNLRIGSVKIKNSLMMKEWTLLVKMKDSQSHLMLPVFFILLPSLVMFFMVMEHWSNVARVSKLSMDHLGLRRFPSGVTQGGYLSGRLSSVS